MMEETVYIKSTNNTINSHIFEQMIRLISRAHTGNSIVTNKMFELKEKKIFSSYPCDTLLFVTGEYQMKIAMIFDTL